MIPFFRGLCFVGAETILSLVSTAQTVQNDSLPIEFTNPEGHELAHVAFALTTLGQGGSRSDLPIDTTTDYFRAVRRHFAPVRDHPLIGRLNERLRKKGPTFFVMNRDAAVGLSFGKSGKLRYKSPAGLGPRLAHNVLVGNTFRRDRKHWNTFVSASHFRDFFHTNQALYAETLRTADRYLPVERMVAWLETNFPGTSPKGPPRQLHPVISPLIGDLHSTMTDRAGAFWMFVPPLPYDTTKGTFVGTEARYSGLLFTEIDHHYCNARGESGKRAKRAFANRTHWVDVSKPAAAYYQDPVKVFNEYATHAAYLLYLRQTYDAATAATIARSRIQQMETGRGFRQFGDFVNEWTRLATTNSTRKWSDWYPALLNWCEQRALTPASTGTPAGSARR